MYCPDKWLLIKIGGQDPHYRVFGTWSGGYIGSDEWRLNSGVKSVSQDEKYYYFTGSSTSIYRCAKEAYGSTAYGWGVIQGYVDSDRFSIMEEPANIMDMDWLI